MRAHLPRDVIAQPISEQVLFRQPKSAAKDAATRCLCARRSRGHIMQPMSRPDDDEYDDTEATRRMNEALRRALNTPPRPQATVRRPRKKAKTTAADQAPPKHDGGAGA